MCSRYYVLLSSRFTFYFFFFNVTATTEIYTLSLHDALPIYPHVREPAHARPAAGRAAPPAAGRDRKSTRLNSSHTVISYAVFCLKKKTPPNMYKHHIGLLIAMLHFHTSMNFVVSYSTAIRMP